MYIDEAGRGGMGGQILACGGGCVLRGDSVAMGNGLGAASGPQS